MHHTTIAIDISKSSFHVVSINNHKVKIDKEFSRAKLQVWMAKQPKSHIVMEACGSAHYWARFAQYHGHTAQLIAPKHVSAFRQGHKTDRNDAFAIATASQQPSTKSVAIKTIEQQGLQSLDRIRQHLTDTQTALSNMLRGLLSEFGLCFAKGVRAFKSNLPDILEDAENQLPHAFRVQLGVMYEMYLTNEQHLQQVDKQLEALINQQTHCKQLMQLEGVGPVNALNLFLTLGEQGQSFNNGREASACIGLTPKQYSTGGVTLLGGIGKHVGNKRLRANLIQGALSVVKVLEKRAPKTTKERWVQQLIELKGKRRAAVALANKTVRTAWAMLHNDTVYCAPILEHPMG
jgi:transposase